MGNPNVLLHMCLLMNKISGKHFLILGTKMKFSCKQPCDIISDEDSIYLLNFYLTCHIKLSKKRMLYPNHHPPTLSRIFFTYLQISMVFIDF